MVWLVILRQDDSPLRDYNVFRSESKADRFAMLARDNNWRVAIIKLTFQDDNVE